MQNDKIAHRLKALRSLMHEKQLDAFIFPSTDPHNGEYVPDHWKGREWISGFDGSAGTAVVTAEKVALWTDSRYFIAAAEQLQGTGFVLMKERISGTPTVAEWIAQTVGGNAQAHVGVDGSVYSATMVKDLSKELENLGNFIVVTSIDPLADIWTDRPAIPDNPIVIHPIEYAGETAQSKLQRIREAMVASHADALLVTALDDIAWTLNLRGCDVHCNPVFVAYLLVEKNTATLFADSCKISQEVRMYLDSVGVETAGYGDVGKWLTEMTEGSVMIDPNTANHNLFHAARCRVVEAPSPIPAMKTVKNAVEIEGFHNAMRRDGVAMVRFLIWLEKAMEKGSTETEISIDRKLTELRSGQPLYKGLSFDTIAGYAAHGAIVHYEATEESDVPLQRKGLLLLDSGAQYLDATTDITRTIALGPVTDEERHVYTLVLKGHLRLQNLAFPEGACGSQLDAVARSPLWKEGLNFLHGTGHGVGSYLNVHEGPHQIRMEWKPAPMYAGMTVTNEPGIYVEGKFGVRIENTMLTVGYKNTDFGNFLKFQPLTLCPIDQRPIDFSLLDNEEIQWLNQYHKLVYDELSPFLNPEEQAWLRHATKPASASS